MLRIFAALCALWLANSGHTAEVPVDEAHLQWEAPVQNVDGSTLPQCPPDHVEGTLTDPKCLDGFVAYWGTSAGNYTQELQVTDQAQRDLIIPESPGTYFFVMTAYNSGGDESAYSGEVSKDISSPIVPLPPLPSFVPQESAVFTVKMQPDIFLLFHVGIVPAETECYLDRGAPAGYGVVPFDAVVWTDPDGPRPIAVVARCE